jgi:hypothetical protein
MRHPASRRAAADHPVRFSRLKVRSNMLHEPKKVEAAVQLRKDQQTGRFEVVKLEQRIAPACHTNPQGKKVGCGHGTYV